MSGAMIDEHGGLSETARARKRAGLEAVLAAQGARVRRRRVARLGLGVGLAASVAIVAVMMRPAGASREDGSRHAAGSPDSSREGGAPRHSHSPSPPPTPTITERGPMIRIVRNDEALAEQSRVDESELRVLLAEAGEPTGLLRVGTRVIAEGQLVVAASDDEAPIP